MRFIGSSLLALALAAPAFPQSAETAPVKVPFVLMSSGHFLVTVMVNGKGPYKLIFDTGAPTMLVSNRLAKDAAVMDKKAPAASIFNPMGSMGQKAKTFEIGPLKAENVPLMVFDHPTVKAFSDFYRKDHGPIDGIVGFPFFARYKMVVDYQAKELTMTPNGYKPTDVIESMMAMMMGAQQNQGKPKVVGPTGVWGVVVDKDGTDESAGVSVTSVMTGSAAEQAGLKKGDRVLTIDGRWTDSVADMYQAASHVKTGNAATVVVNRHGVEIKLSLKPTPGL